MCVHVSMQVRLRVDITLCVCVCLHMGDFRSTVPYQGAGQAMHLQRKEQSPVNPPSSVALSPPSTHRPISSQGTLAFLTPARHRCPPCCLSSAGCLSVCLRLSTSVCLDLSVYVCLSKSVCLYVSSLPVSLHCPSTCVYSLDMEGSHGNLPP